MEYPGNLGIYRMCMRGTARIFLEQYSEESVREACNEGSETATGRHGSQLAMSGGRKSVQIAMK